MRNLKTGPEDEDSEVPGTQARRGRIVLNVEFPCRSRLLLALQVGERKACALQPPGKGSLS